MSASTTLATPVVYLDDPSTIEIAIRRSLRPAPRKASHARECDWRATNGRLFEIREYDQTEDGRRFFVSEFRPNGRMARMDGDRLVDAWDEPRLRPFLSNPNNFEKSILSAGLDPTNVVRMGGGIGVASRYYATLDDAAGEIAWALRRNEWYQDTDRDLLDDESFQADLRRRELAIREAAKAENVALHEQATASGHGLFKGLHGLSGPLSKDAQQRLLRYLNGPSSEAFSEIASLAIKGGLTVWQAWAQVDATAPISKPLSGPWPRIPDPALLRHILTDVGARSRKS